MDKNKLSSFTEIYFDAKHVHNYLVNVRNVMLCRITFTQNNVSCEFLRHYTKISL